MTAEVFLSRTPRGEDVIVHRALGDGPGPTYATDGPPEIWRSLDDHGWTRVEADAAQVLVVTGQAGTRAVLDGARPQICLVPGRADGAEASALVDAGYVTTMFDGASTWLVHPDRAAALRPSVDHPAQPEEYITEAEHQQQSDLAGWKRLALQNWSRDATGQFDPRRTASAGDDEVAAMRATLSWRITAPLRAVRGLVPVGLGRR